MSRRTILAFVLLAAACNDSDTKVVADTTQATTADTQPTTGDATTTQAETTVAETTATETTADVPDGTSALTGVNTKVTVTAPTPNASCATADQLEPPTGGAAYPWGGLTVGATTYTCNGCPDGLKELQGSWRLHGFLPAPNDDTPDYAWPDPATDGGFVLRVDGNTFYTRDVDPQQSTNEVSRGWYFCSMKPENGQKHLYWVNTETDPSGGAGDVTRTDRILTDGSDRLLVFFFDDPATGTSNFPYPLCRIGSTVGDQTCTDPFAP